MTERLSYTGTNNYMKKPSFTCMTFNDGGSEMEFVAHAKYFTKEETVVACIEEFEENGYDEYENLRHPTIDDIEERTVRYYPKTPGFCGMDYDPEDDNGCYTYCSKGQHGSFPVWVIEFDKLIVKENNI